MSVTKHKTAKGTVYWRVRISDPTAKGGMRHVGQRPTKREAVALEAEALAAARRPTPNTITVAELVDRWLRYHKVKASTKAWHEQMVRGFVRAHGERRVSEIDRMLAVDWEAEHPSTVQVLSALWSYAINEDLAEAQPWRGMTKMSRRELEPGWLTEKDVDDLADAALDAWPGAYGLLVRALVLTAAYVGPRPGELGGLWWTDLYPERQRIRIARQIESKNRTLTTPKSGKERWGYLPAIASEAIAAAPRLHEQFVFVGPGGGLLIESTRNRLWHPIRARVGRPTMHFYELRHFAATRLREHGISSSDVAIQLGHQDGGRLVEQTYSHARAEPALDRVAAAFAPNDTEAREASA